MLSPLPLIRTLALLLVFPLALAACSRQLSQAELLDRAQLALSEGKFGAAEIDIKNALKENPANAAGRRLLGELRLQQRDLEGAAIEFGRALDAQQDPAVAALYAEALLGSGQHDKVVALQEEGFFALAAENPAFLAILARAQAVSGDTFEAQQTLEAALTLEPANAQVQLARAFLLVRHTQDVKAALQVLQELTESHADFADGWSLYGEIARSSGDLPLAETAYRQASQLNSARLDDRLGLVAALVSQEKYAEAAVELAPLEELIPNHPAVNYSLALIAMSEDDTDRALDALADVFNVAPNHMPSVYLAANAHFRVENLESAENHLKTFLGTYPRNVNARQMLATVHLRKGEIDKAEPLARELVKESPKDEKSLNILAMILTAQSQHSASAELYQEIVNITPDAPEVRMELGTELVRAGEIERGIEELEKAKSLDPDNGFIRSRLVLAYSAHGDDTAVQRELESFRSLVGPSDPRPEQLAGEIALRAENKEKAAEHFSRAIEIDPESSTARIALAAIAMQDDNTDEAVAVLQGGLEAKPGDLQNLLSLAEVYEQRGEVDAMVDTLGKAVKANPDALEPRLRLGQHYFKQGLPSQTVDLLTPMRDANNQDPRLHQLLVGAFLALEDTGAAVTSGRELVKLLPNNPLGLRLAAQAEIANGEPAMAEQYLRKVVAAQPADVESRKLLIQSLMMQNKLEESSAELALMPKGAIAGDRVDLARGEIELALGKPVEAEVLLRKAYAAKADSKTLAYLNVALMRQGKVDEAMQLGEAWLAAHPEDQLILRQIGASYLAQGQDEKAAAVYAKLLQLSPEDPLVLNNLAWVSRKNDSKRALEYVDKALQAVPEDPAILDTKAMILVEMDDYEQALTVNQEALDLSDKNPGFLLHRAEILAAAGKKQDAVAVIEALLAEERFAKDPRLQALLEKYQAL